MAIKPGFVTVDNIIRIEFGAKDPFTEKLNFGVVEKRQCATYCRALNSADMAAFHSGDCMACLTVYGLLMGVAATKRLDVILSLNILLME